jgi:hypothetical protein
VPLPGWQSHEDANGCVDREYHDHLLLPPFVIMSRFTLIPTTLTKEK